MKNIIFIAPPGAGKGTQSDLLVKKYGYIHISTGELFRNEMALGTKLGKSIENTINAGILISDDTTTELLKKRLIQDDIRKGFILEGYPRTPKQCEMLENILNELKISLDVVIYLDMDEETAMRRALGRITCPNCNRGYNKYEKAMQPKIEGMCDDCNIALVGRDDDNEEAFKTRFNQYKAGVEPILDYYRALGILNVIDNSGTPEETFERIESVIK